MGASRPRPTLYPRQLVVTCTDETFERIEAEAQKAGVSKSAIARDYLATGMAAVDEALSRGRGGE